MEHIGTFPFGQPVRKVIQTDRTPKKVFVLGVYASAVHARWINTKNKTVVNAMAVASEPYIFWRGDNQESIIQEIKIPEELGQLIPPVKTFNGPSAAAMDDYILGPLGINRQQAWLCDLVPHSYVNPNQQQAITRAYLPLIEKYHLPQPSVPLKPRKLTDEARRNQIIEEIIESQANYLILLGNEPIQWFLKYFDNRWKHLADFGTTKDQYGCIHETKIGNKQMKILPLTHPHQIARLGNYSKEWYQAHQEWLTKKSSQIAKTINSS